MKRYRRYSNDFKRDLVDEIILGNLSVTEASKQHNICETLITRWMKQIEAGTLKDKTTTRELYLERELDQYKKKVGELTIQVELLKKQKQIGASKKRLNGCVVTM